MFLSALMHCGYEKNVSRLALIFSVLLLSSCVAPMPAVPPTDSAIKESIRFLDPERDQAFDTKWFSLDIDESKARIGHTGLLELQPGDTNKGGFQLPLPAAHFIEGFMYGVYRGDLVLYYQLHDGHYLRAGVMRIDYRQKRILWDAVIPAFNIGEPLAVDKHLYVSAIGFVGKLDLESGRYLWRHSDLYHDSIYNAFRKPLLTQGMAVFIEHSTTRSDEDAYYVSVDDTTGHIIAMHKKK